MKLMTKTLAKQLPRIKATETEDDPTIRAHFFNPQGCGDWYVLEYDGEDELFGLADLGHPELGYFSLSELQGYQGRFGLGIERDLHWQPVPLSSKTSKPA